jgi:hypothetical protein
LLTDLSTLYINQVQISFLPLGFTWLIYVSGFYIYPYLSGILKWIYPPNLPEGAFQNRRAYKVTTSVLSPTCEGNITLPKGHYSRMAKNLGRLYMKEGRICREISCKLQSIL